MMRSRWLPSHAHTAVLALNGTSFMGDWLGLTGRRVLVAGAGGIGAACALAFADAGSQVVAADVADDRLSALDTRVTGVKANLATSVRAVRRPSGSVSYTHLTLPT